MRVVAITPRSFRQVHGEHLDLLAANDIEARYLDVDRTLTEDEMVTLVTGCRALIVGVDPVTDEVLAAGPLSLIVKYGSGLDNIDLEAARRRGVVTLSTPGTNAQSVAELTIAMMFALARRLVPHHEAMVSGSRARHVGIELAGRRLGILGFGNVGRRVAALARCLGMDVVIHDPEVVAEGFTPASLDQALRSDVVSVHVPYDASTHHLIGREALAAMPRGSLLVNTSRPAIVDEGALADALDQGHLFGAAFDDMAGDADTDARLLASGRFLATPHAGAATTEAVMRTGTAAVQALLEHRSIWQM